MANEQNLTPFSKTYQPINSGRKPSKLKKYIKDNGLSSSDISAAIKFVMVLSEERLKVIVSDRKIPMLIRLFVRAFLDDFKKGTLNNIEKLMERTFGKPVQPIENTGSMLFGGMSQEEILKRTDELIKKRDE